MGPAKTRGRVPGRSPHRPVPRRETPSRHRLHTLLALAGVVLLGALAVVVLPGVLGGGDPVADRAAELADRDRQRDAGLTRELVGTAEQARDAVVPVLDGLERALGEHPDGADGVASAGDVAEWRRSVEAAAAPLRERPSGGTAVNLARSGLAGAVATVGRAVEAYAAALDARGALRERLRALADDLRRDALAAWSVAANQLDVAGIEAGLGHVHVFLGEPHGHGGG
ncbi:hypothetical protein B0I33_106380 [Prauserella shujinwangii]|uniref:Uncharacterized protein n=1 Tax=Prauserella shujinwangii TaxID=1453103 RepID=A0A2T0LU60_9PSEU|nr:hypothetical protein [Prauserella shujinwangii]PRX47278.1 hypothetical protein B0I33_106380 [Prauserella shujinwangii]